MTRLIQNPSEIKACGTKTKIIKEYIGKVNSKTDQVSIAFMESPSGWEEPGQTPQFDEYSVVTEGTLHVETKSESFDVHAGQAVIVSKGDWVRYSTPGDQGAKYVAICNPAFSPDTVCRDAE